MKEQWKPIPGWEGLYEASDAGRVRSLGRARPNRRPSSRGYGPRILKQCKAKGPGGYYMVWLSRNGESRTNLVHRLVLLAFVGPAPAGTEGCHIDCDSTNNALTNLRWGTKLENAADTKALLRHAYGLRQGNARFSSTDIERVRGMRKMGCTYEAIAAWMGMSKSHVSGVVTGRARVLG